MTGARPILAQDWVLAANPSVYRASHTATLLKDRKVLVSGVLASAELYGPKRGSGDGNLLLLLD